jgi:hypothetical protein
MLLEEELQVVMRKEIEILRDILTNLKREQMALLAEDENKLDGIFDERLNYMEGYQEIAHQLVLCAEELAFQHGKRIPMTHEQTLDLFEELISIEDIELRALRFQLLALTDAIERQSTILKYYLKNGQSALQTSMPLRRATEKVKKVKLEVIDHKSLDLENL